MFATKEEALRHVVQLSLAEVQKGKPVLAGTQDINDADSLFDLIAAAVSPDVTVNLISAKNDREAAEVFSTAGGSGTITIATQFAGRGVDIRLTAEARIWWISVDRGWPKRHVPT